MPLPTNPHPNTYRVEGSRNKQNRSMERTIKRTLSPVTGCIGKHVTILLFKVSCLLLLIEKIKRTCSVIIRSPEGVEGKKSPTRLYDPQFNF